MDHDNDKEDDEDCECKSNGEESLDDDDSASYTSSTDVSTSTHGTDEQREANEILNKDRGVPKQGLHLDDVSLNSSSVQEDEESQMTEQEPRRRGSRARKAPNNWVPTMTGQTHSVSKAC